MQLLLLEAEFAVCRLGSKAAVPSWVEGADFVSITRTPDELSVVCESKCIPEGVRCELAWRCFKVMGPLEFSLVGVLSSLLEPLREAQISVFVMSTFDTDYVLVKDEKLDAAISSLKLAGHEVLL